MVIDLITSLMKSFLYVHSYTDHMLILLVYTISICQLKTNALSTKALPHSSKGLTNYMDVDIDS